MMKNIKALPISIVTIILVVFLSVSFTVFDKSQAVSISGVAGSYAQIYAKDNDVNFIAIDDSENPDVKIPTTEESTTKKSENATKKRKTQPKQTEKENSEFSYNYDDKTVRITAYKGSSSVVTVPKTIDGLPVKEIEFDVLNKGISTVEIPKSVTSIKTEFTSPRYTVSFYTAIAIAVLGYIFAVVLTFIGFKKQQNADGTFYGIPFLYSGTATYIILTVLSTAALFFNLNPVIQFIIALIIVALALGRLLQNFAARELVTERGEQIKEQTFFIKSLTIDAQSLANSAKTDEMKTLANNVYETVRYSDPMSNSQLEAIENEIETKFNQFSAAVKSDNVALAKSTADELVTFIKDRNNKCKLLK